MAFIQIAWKMENCNNPFSKLPKYYQLPCNYDILINIEILYIVHTYLRCWLIWKYFVKSLVQDVRNTLIPLLLSSKRELLIMEFCISVTTYLAKLRSCLNFLESPIFLIYDTMNRWILWIVKIIQISTIVTHAIFLMTK